MAADRGWPPRGLLSLPELRAPAHAEDPAARSEASRRYSVEWHRRLAWAVAVLHVSARALDVAPSSPFVVAWTPDILLALVAAALILRAHRQAMSVVTA